MFGVALLKGDQYTDSLVRIHLPISSESQQINNIDNMYQNISEL